MEIPIFQFDGCKWVFIGWANAAENTVELVRESDSVEMIQEELPLAA